MHPATARRLPSGPRSVLVGLWPVVVAATGLLLLSNAIAGLLVWALG